MEEYRVTLDQGGLNRDFVFLGGPLESSDTPPELYAAIGRASAQWARLEQHIDAVLLHLNSLEHSEKIFDPNHPIAISGKIKLLKRWFNQHPALSGLSEDVRTLTSKLKELIPHRHALIHGVLEAWDGETNSAVFRTLKFMGDDEFKLQTHTYTIDGISEVSYLASACNRYLCDISRAIFTRDALAQLRKP
jgi:hypothetical protein